ncbi:MAG: alpha/beta fold hydrolase [Chitinophagaceae bacterium]
MQKLLFSILLTVLTSIAYSQDGKEQSEMDKVRAEYEKLLNDPKHPYGKNNATGKYYNVRGMKMYAETYGSGEPLLFIHGNGGSINNFIMQIPYFEKKYKVIVADSRAHGKTIDPKDSLTYEMMADDYAALLDAMKIDSAYVVGWSDGGINGLLLAIRHPEKVKKLAITGANLRPDSSAVCNDVIQMIRPSYLEAKNRTEWNAEQLTTKKLMTLMIEQPNISLVTLQHVLCPTLVIAGDHDVITVEHTVEIFTHIPRAYLWILPKSGHSTPINFSNEFNEKVDYFFKRPYVKYNTEMKFF